MRGNFTNHKWLIHELTKALNGSVRQEEYVSVLAALSRCRDLLEKVSPKIKDAELQNEVSLYLNVLSGIVEDIKDHPTSYITDDDWKGAENHLRKKGVIK